MRSTFTIILTVLAVLLAGLTAIQVTQGSLDSVLGSGGKKKGDLIYKFSPEEVSRMILTGPEGSRAVISREGGHWITEEPWQDLADARLAQSISHFASQLLIEDSLKRDEVENLAEFGLQNDRIEIQLTDADGRELCHFHLGRNTAWRSVDAEENNFPTVVIRPIGGKGEDSLYICADRADPKLRTIGIRSLFQQSLIRFRDHRVFYNHPRFASEITLAGEAAAITLAKDPESRSWLITKPFQLSADPAAIQKTIALLGALEATEVLDPSAVTLPPPSPANIARTITTKFSLVDGKEETISLFVYPPETPDALTVFGRVGQDLDRLRPAVLRLPNAPRSPLSQLPTGVNELRNRTLTSLSVAQIKALEISDSRGREVSLSLARDPHERALRWYAQAAGYTGPANEQQVADTFETLVKEEVLRFVDDAATNLASYGLDQPLRSIQITLKDDSQLTYHLGRKIRDRFYARLPGGKQAVEVGESILSQPERHRAALQKLRDPASSGLLPVESPVLLGFNGNLTATVNLDQVLTEVEIGRRQEAVYYATREGSQRVSQVSSSALSTLTVQPFEWRDTRLWNLNAFEVRGIIIERRGRAPLNLRYEFFKQSWTASQSGKDLTARLNTNKANRLLEKLAELRVKKWISRETSAASALLEFPNLKISILVEEVNEEGNTTGLKPQTLEIVSGGSGSGNRLFYGRSSSAPDLFLLDLSVVQRLAVELLE